MPQTSTDGVIVAAERLKAHRSFRCAAVSEAESWIASGARGSRWTGRFISLSSSFFFLQLAEEAYLFGNVIAVMPVVGNTVGHVVSEAPPPDPRHDMLWMSVGILIGYFVLSVIMKGLDNLRGNRTAKLEDMVNEIDDLKNRIAVRDRMLSSLEADVRSRDGTIQSRDTTIASERRQRTDAENEVARLMPYERDANDLRPQVGTLRDEIRDKNRKIASLKADITKIQGDLEVAYQRFEIVNQRAAEGKDVERNLKSFIREREVALERTKGQHEEQLETLREKHEEEKESMQQQREQEIEAVRRSANAELDAIIITKNRESVPMRFFKFFIPDVSGIVSPNVPKAHKQSTGSEDDAT
ncbi:uncharacterized protein PAC_10104 [Phialocephala subalpina]|uniref:Uncharacterized protein n=1 Tax=Phialocephala subalpina TaxID=576137 RepID=A0A1L7X5A7_9HELO|nr:uncharacterized protein PAC_10104 [Phialocephala subalpina]